MAKGKARRFVKQAHSAGRKAVGKGRRNYRRSSSGGGLMNDVKEHAYAGGGGAVFGFLESLGHKLMPAGSDGTSMIPGPVMSLGAVLVTAIGGRMIMGSRAPGLGAAGAFVYELNLPKMLGINDALDIGDYVRIGDYVSRPGITDFRIGAGNQAFVNNGVQRIYPRGAGNMLGDIGGHHHRHHSVNDGGEYGGGYGSRYGS